MQLRFIHGFRRPARAFLRARLHCAIADVRCTHYAVIIADPSIRDRQRLFKGVDIVLDTVKNAICATYCAGLQTHLPRYLAESCWRLVSVRRSRLDGFRRDNYPSPRESRFRAFCMTE